MTFSKRLSKIESKLQASGIDGMTFILPDPQDPDHPERFTGECITMAGHRMTGRVQWTRTAGQAHFEAGSYAGPMKAVDACPHGETCSGLACIKN